MSTEKEKAQCGKLALTAGVSIHNAENVNGRFMEIMIGLLDYVGDDFIYGIVFNTTNGPIGKNGKPVFSGYYAGVRSIVINLVQHFDQSLVTAKHPENPVSLSAVLWYNLITSLLHEMKHALDLSECADEATYQVTDEACEICQNWAHETLLKAAAGGHVDFSMPDMLHDDFFGPRLEVVLDDIIVAKEPEVWQIKQRELFETGEVFNLEGHGTKCFMEYLQQLNGGKYTWTTKVVEEPIMSEPEPEVKLEDLSTAAESIVVEPTAQPLAAVPLLPKPHTVVSEVPNVPEATPVMATVIQDGAETMAPGSTVVDSQVDLNFSNEGSPENDVDEEDMSEPIPDYAVEPHGLAGAQCQQILAEVANRLHAHMYNKCGYQLNSDVAFVNPGAVCEPCYIGDIPGAVQLIVSYDTLNEHGGIMKHVPVFVSRDAGDLTLPLGHIKGITSKDGLLPAFVFYVNVDGRLEKRALRAQSPVKYEADGITLKAWSRDLRAGTCISVLFRDVLKESGLSPILAKVTTQGGQDTKVTLNPFKAEWKKEFSFGN